MLGITLDAGSLLKDVLKIVFLFQSGESSRLDPDLSKWQTGPAAILAPHDVLAVSWRFS